MGKMITSEEAHKSLDMVASHCDKDFKYEVLLRDFIEQQEKVNELLGLYRKVRKQVEEYNDTPNGTPKVLHLALDIKETLDEIEKLESELNE
jgi:hypothetical protein